MKNPNTAPVISFDDKHLREVTGFYYPMVVAAFDCDNDTFTIASDIRYACDYDLDGCNRDTAFYDIDDFIIPACAIHAIIGADTDYQDSNDFVGHYFLMPGAAKK